MENPTLDDYEGVEDITRALWELEQANKKEKEVSTNKPLKEYGEIVTSLI